VTPALALIAATGSPDNRNKPARVPPQLGQATPVAHGVTPEGIQTGGTEVLN
jgi:hypothetical protein